MSLTTYKLGNKAKCLIKAYSAGQIGNELIEYDGQPYTSIEECSCEISFQDKQESSSSEVLVLRDSRSFIREIRLSNCLITSKILNLIFFKNDEELVAEWENCVSDENGKIFLNINDEEAYQVFIYSSDGQLENAYGKISIEEGISVNEPNENYFVSYYREPTEAENTYSLNMQNNFYLSLDIKIIGNENDKTKTGRIHINKCSLRAEKTMRFSKELNTIDLVFTVINAKDDDVNNDNYIIL